MSLIRARYSFYINTVSTCNLIAELGIKCSTLPPCTINSLTAYSFRHFISGTIPFERCPKLPIYRLFLVFRENWEFIIEESSDFRRRGVVAGMYFHVHPKSLKLYLQKLGRYKKNPKIQPNTCLIKLLIYRLFFKLFITKFSSSFDH